MTRMPRRAAVGLAVVVLAIPLGPACGGAEFTAKQGGDDAGDAATPDVAAEAVATDASSDSPWLPDALAPPPAHCGGTFTCVAQVPVGWNGPVELYAGASPDPPCDTGFGAARDATDGVNAPPATCACNCGGPQSVQCSPTQLSIYGSSTCTAANLCNTVTPVPGACTTLGTSGCATVTATPGTTVPSPQPSGGHCPPIPTKGVSPATWSVTARACGSGLVPEQVDCASGSICAPQPSSPFFSALCIAHEGDVPCPPGPYGSRHLYYAGLDDGRDCTPCTCDGITGDVCVATLQVFTSTDHSCTGGMNTFFSPLTCGPVQQPSDVELTLLASGGSCNPSQVSAQGSATPTNPATICCLP